MSVINSMTGYKATDANMKCRGHQFKLGRWYSVKGDVRMCGNGFHFCTSLPGVWAYYNDAGTRVFKCEAKEVLVTSDNTGTSTKKVCRKIRLTEEIKVVGSCNTASPNIGDSNSGAENLGHYNCGSHNQGNYNSGDNNLGSLNSGYRNTGDSNTGERNRGNKNTGDSNTGNNNSGYYNIGGQNSGDGNCTNASAGCFCTTEPLAMCFDRPTKYTLAQLRDRFPIYALACALQRDEPICFDSFKRIPNITPRRLKLLHNKFIAARKATANG